MKKVFIFFVLVIFLIGCQNVKDLESTRLDSISIDEDIKIHSNINDIDLSQYQRSSRFSHKRVKYRYANMAIETNKKRLITYMFGFFSENKITINEESNLHNINDLKRVLGANYKESWKDREQDLKSYTYYDKDNEIILEIVYSDYTKELVWIEISAI